MVWAFNCVVICWLLYVGSPWHLRTMPQTMPAWHIVLANTLGSRQGTLYKAPRNAEVKLQDDNVFCKSDYWNLNACRASAPLPLSHQVYITILISFFWGGGLNNPCCLLKKIHKVIMWHQKVVPSSVMSKDVHWRNLVFSLVDMLFFKNNALLPGNFWTKVTKMIQTLKDKEETAQWFGSPATIRAILEACMSRVSSIKSQCCIIHHFTMYDGNLEKVRFGKLFTDVYCFFTVNATNILTKVLFFKGGVGHDEWVQPRSLFGMLLRVHQPNHLSVCSHPAERQAFGGQKVENQFCVQTGFLLFLFSERCKQDRNGKKDVGSWAPWLRSFKRSLIFLHLQLQGLLRWGCAEWLLQAIWKFPGMSDKNGWTIQSEVS